MSLWDPPTWRRVVPQATGLAPTLWTLATLGLVAYTDVTGSSDAKSKEEATRQWGNSIHHMCSS
jgi:hypothetical protein